MFSSVPGEAAGRGALGCHTPQEQDTGKEPHSGRALPENAQNQEVKPFPPAVSFYCPLLIEHNIVPTAQEKGPRFSFTEQAKGTRLELRGHT